MEEKITYYTIVTHSKGDANPAGVLRRVENTEGETDEVFSRNLRWEFSSLLYAAEQGDLTNDFNEISKEEADRIVERIRAQAGGDE